MANLSELRDGYGNVYTIGSLTDEIASVRHNYPWETVAHRGYCATGLPENSLPALIEAAKQGFNVCEADIRRTSDGIFIMNHDATITGTVNGESVTYTIADETYETISQVLLGASAEYGNIYPVTWETFCKTANILGIVLHVDNRATGAEITPELVSIAMKCGMSGKVTYTYDHANVLATDPRAGLTVAIDANYETSFETYKGYLNGMNKIYATVPVTSEYCTEEYILAAHKYGFLVEIWSISAMESTYTKALDLRPDKIEQLTAAQGTNVSELYINSLGIG